MIFPLHKWCCFLGACGVCIAGQRISCRFHQMRSLRRQLPVAQFAMEQNVAWMDWRWAFFASDLSATHSLASFRWWIHGSPNLLTGWDPAVKLRLQPLLSTGGVWHLKLENHVQAAVATCPNSCKFHYSYQMQIQDSNSATCISCLIVLVLLSDSCRSWMMNISLFGKVSQESLGITRPRQRKGGDKVGTS